MVPTGPNRRAPLALVVGGVLAGGNAVGIRFTNRELDPLFGAGLRFLLAAALLGVVAWFRGLALPRDRALLGGAIFGVLNFAGAFGLGYYALVHIEAGAGSALLALTPLMTIVLAALHGEERIRVDALLGGVLAVAGVAVLSETSLRGSVPLLAVMAAFGSVLCFAEAAVLISRFPAVHPIMMNAVAMGTGALVLLILSIGSGEAWNLPSRGTTWIALAYLVAVGSIVVFLLYLYVLHHWEASRAVYFDVLIPPAAVLISHWLDDEPLTAGLLVGGTLVLLGAYLGAMRPSPASGIGENSASLS